MSDLGFTLGIIFGGTGFLYACFALIVIFGVGWFLAGLVSFLFEGLFDGGLTSSGPRVAPEPLEPWQSSAGAKLLKLVIGILGVVAFFMALSTVKEAREAAAYGITPPLPMPVPSPAVAQLPSFSGATDMPVHMWRVRSKDVAPVRSEAVIAPGFDAVRPQQSWQWMMRRDLEAPPLIAP